MRGIKTCGIFVLGAACGILGVFALIWASSPQQHQTPMVQHDLLAAITKVHDAVRLVDIIVEKSIYVLDELGMLQSKQEAVDSFAKNLIGDSRIFLYPRQQAAVEIQRTILDTDTLRPLLHPKLSIPFTTKQIVNKKAIQIERIKWMYTIDRAVENERDRVTSNVADLSRSINKLLVTEYLTPSDVPDWKTDITCHWDKSCDINGKLHANLNTTMLLGLARVCWPLHQNRIALLELQEAYSDLHDACAGDWSSNYRAAVTDFGREVVDELLEAAGVQIARTGALFNNGTDLSSLRSCS